MHHYWKHIPAIAAAFLLALTACSVKEDRQECPCWLDVDVTGCGKIARNVTVSAWNKSIWQGTYKNTVCCESDIWVKG